MKPVISFSCSTLTKKIFISTSKTIWELRHKRNFYTLRKSVEVYDNMLSVLACFCIAMLFEFIYFGLSNQDNHMQSGVQYNESNIKWQSSFKEVFPEYCFNKPIFMKNILFMNHRFSLKGHNDAPLEWRDVLSRDLPTYDNFPFQLHHSISKSSHLLAVKFFANRLANHVDVKLCI